MKKMKLYLKTLIALAGTGAIFGSFGLGLYIYGQNEQGNTHYSPLSLKNNLDDFKESHTYKTFFKDPITLQKIGNYNYYENSIDGIPFWEWYNRYVKKHKKVPLFVVQTGPIEFQNFHIQAILPQTFIEFVKWFANDVPWGPELSTLTYFRISKGYRRGSDSVTLGSYSHSGGSRHVNLFPDSFFGVVSNDKFLMRLTKEPIAKKDIPILIENINKANDKLMQKYGKDFWQDYAIRLYSLQREESDKYIPIVSNVGNLIDKLEIGMATSLEKVSNYDVEWNPKTMKTQVVKRDSYRLNIKKQSSKIQIWASLAGNNWKGLSFNWLKYTTHHEMGHMQTLSYAQGFANNYVGSKVASVFPNSVSDGYDFDELNRYLQARAPQIRALRVSVSLHKNKNGEWDWNFYQDRLKDWKNGAIKNKPDPRDFDQIAFEYKPTGFENWTREGLEKIFGSKIDPTDAEKAPYKINPEEFLANLKAKKWPRFFIYSLKDAREFAKVTKIPVHALFLMNAFDGLAATKNPTLRPYNWTFVGGRLGTRFISRESESVSNYPKLLDKNNNFVTAQKAIGNIQAWNKVPVLINLPLDSRIGSEADFELIDYVSEKDPEPVVARYKINPLARDRNGKLLSSQKGLVQERIEYLVEELIPDRMYGRGSEYLIAGDLGVGFPDDYNFNLLTKPLDISTWKKVTSSKESLADGKTKMITNFQINEMFALLNARTRIASYYKYRMLINRKMQLDKIKSPSGSDVYFRYDLVDNRWPIEYVEIKDDNGIHKIKKLVNSDGSIYDVKSKSTPSKDALNPNLIDIQMPDKGIFEEIYNPKKINITLGAKFLEKFKNPILTKIMLRFKFEEPISPSADKNHFAGYRELLKWLKKPNFYSHAPNINGAFTHYWHEFSEALTRDWVQITQKILEDYKFNYDSTLFPNSNRHTGVNAIVDPESIINQVYNQKSQKTFEQVIDYEFLDKKTSKRNIDYKIEFVRMLYNNIKNDKSKKNNELLKTFHPRNYKVNEGKEIDSITSLKKNNLSYLNIGLVNNYDPFATSDRIDHWLYRIQGSYLPLDGWSEILERTTNFYVDRWTRSTIAKTRAEESTANSWVLYDDKRKPIPYEGDLKNFNGHKIKTRPEAYWVFLLKSSGVSLRNVAAMWLEKKRDAIAMWGFVPLKYKSKIKYLKFVNKNDGRVVKKHIRFDVDNLFYYNQEQGGGNRRRVADEGFTSWNIDYVVLGTWKDSDVKNGLWKMSFADENGENVDIFWNGQKITMTGNGAMKIKTGSKTTKHIIASNHKTKMYAPSYIEQNNKGEDIIYIRYQFPI